MQEIPKPTYENLEELAGLAFATSRDAAAAMRADLLPRLPRKDQSGAVLLLRLLGERRVFDQQVLVEIGNIESALTDMIAEGTSEIEHYVHDEAMTGTAVWQERKLTPDADRLSGVLISLIKLQTLIHSVHDILDAERAIEHLRMRSRLRRLRTCGRDTRTRPHRRIFLLHHADAAEIAPRFPQSVSARPPSQAAVFAHSGSWGRAIPSLRHDETTECFICQ